jgi:hypothetical protein
MGKLLAGRIQKKQKNRRWDGSAADPLPHSWLILGGECEGDPLVAWLQPGIVQRLNSA